MAWSELRKVVVWSELWKYSNLSSSCLSTVGTVVQVYAELCTALECHGHKEILNSNISVSHDLKWF